MHRRSLATLAASLLFAFAIPVQASQDIVGTWTWTMPNTNCKITRTFKADGTSVHVNGQKTMEATYRVKPDRDSKVPMLIFTVTKDDNNKNCDGNTTANARSLAYLDFNWTKSEMSMCLDEKKTACMGPYKKQ
jgi:hypothetical protein